MRILFGFIFLAALGGWPPVLQAQDDGGFRFSGVLNSRFLGLIGAGEASAFSPGFETWANLRFQTDLLEGGTVYGALNFIAASGSVMGTAVYGGGDRYAAALEPERLYFRLRGEWVQLDLGLLRLPFGYGTVWGPMDFLNPRSPLLPDARPRGVLGGAFAVYPAGMLKFQVFAAAPHDSLASGGEGTVAGFAGEQHWGRAGLQGLYAYETPRGAASLGRHRMGLSFKADLGAGFTGDALYTYDPDDPAGMGGLSAVAGVEYFFLGGDLFLLSEYLYSGEKSSTALGPENPLGRSNRHYLALVGAYKAGDFTNIGLTFVAALEDLSFSPSLSLEYEVLQGVTLSLSVQVPLDRDLFTGNGRRGELGPLPPDSKGGGYASITAGARLRF